MPQRTTLATRVREFIAPPKPPAPEIATEPEPLAPAVPEADETTLSGIQARIIRLRDEHARAVVAAERDLAATVAALIEKQGRLEVQAAQEVDEGIAARMKAVHAYLTASAGEDADTSAEARALDARQQRLRERVQPVLDAADAVMVSLQRWWREYRDVLTDLRATDRHTLLRGLPVRGTVLQQTASYGLVADVQRAVDNLLDLYGLALNTIRTRSDEIERLIAFGARNLSDQDLERALAQELSELGSQNTDLIAHLHLVSRGLTTRLETIREMREKYAGTDAAGTPAFINNSQLIAALDAADQRTKGGDGRTQAETNWSVFDRAPAA